MHAVVGAIADDRAARVLACAGAQQHVEPAFLAPDLGVADVVGAVGGIVGVGDDDLLGAEVDAVVGTHTGLVGQAAVVGAVARGPADVARVVVPDLAAVRSLVGAGDVGAAGVGAVAVACGVGHHMAAEEDPVDQVAAYEVAPAVGAVVVAGVLGRVLAAYVVGAAELAEAVGVADRAVVRGEV